MRGFPHICVHYRAVNLWVTRCDYTEFDSFHKLLLFHDEIARSPICVQSSVYRFVCVYNFFPNADGKSRVRLISALRPWRVFRINNVLIGRIAIYKGIRVYIKNWVQVVIELFRLYILWRWIDNKRFK